jgi:hypothetical protein
MITEFSGPNAQQYSLAHLKPLDCDVSLTINKQVYRVPIVIIFSNHCYTDAVSGTIQRNDPWYFATDSTGHRTFSVDRWQASLALPVHLKKMIVERLHCYRLNKASQFVRIHDPAKQSRFDGWYVFFSFDRPKAGETAAVRVSVTSHHYRNGQPETLKSREHVRFHVLLAKWLAERQDILAQLPKFLP